MSIIRKNYRLKKKPRNPNLRKISENILVVILQDIFPMLKFTYEKEDYDKNNS